MLPLMPGKYDGFWLCFFRDNAGGESRLRTKLARAGPDGSDDAAVAAAAADDDDDDDDAGIAEDAEAAACGGSVVLCAEGPYSKSP